MKASSKTMFIIFWGGNCSTMDNDCCSDSDILARISGASPLKPKWGAVALAASDHPTATAAALNCFWYVFQDCLASKDGALNFVGYIF